MYRVRSRYTGGMYAGGVIKATHNRYSRWNSGGRSGHEEIHDWTSPGPPYTKDNSLYLSKKTLRPTRADGLTLKAFGIYPATVNRMPIGIRLPEAIPNASPPNWALLETQALASVNPSRPVVNFPNFLWELRELPSLLRDTGRFLATRGGSGLRDPGGTYLGYTFGWAPLISDLRSLINLVNEGDAYRDRLIRAAQQERVEGRLGSWTNTWFVNSPTNYFPYVTEVNYRVREKVTAWFVGDYELLDNFPDSGGLAERLNYLGFSQPMSALWNSIPWSWLINYFIGVSTFIEATEGSIRFSLNNITIMQKSELECIYTSNSNNWLVGDEGSLRNETKFRVASPLARPRLAFRSALSGKQISILAALAASRSRYGR